MDIEKMKKLYQVNPFNQTMKGELVTIEEGHVVGRLKMEPMHHNI